MLLNIVPLEVTKMYVISWESINIKSSKDINIVISLEVKFRNCIYMSNYIVKIGGMK
jgi:hypothetical protein